MADGNALYALTVVTLIVGIINYRLSGTYRKMAASADDSTLYALNSKIIVARVALIVAYFFWAAMAAQEGSSIIFMASMTISLMLTYITLPHLERDNWFKPGSHRSKKG